MYIIGGIEAPTLEKDLYIILFCYTLKSKTCFDNPPITSYGSSCRFVVDYAAVAEAIEKALTEEGFTVRMDLHPDFTLLFLLLLYSNGSIATWQINIKAKSN